MAGPLLKGAFVAFTDTFLVPRASVVGFQFNPETMTHEWAGPEETRAPGEGRSNPLAVNGLPGETFRFELILDAADLIADGGPGDAAAAQQSGIYSRLAAIELLQYPVAAPTAGGLLGTVGASVAAAAAGAADDTERPVPPSQVPLVLFVWGPARILPVRVMSLSIAEQLFDAQLNPTQATVSISVRVLPPEELAYVAGPLRVIALTAYAYTEGLRKAAALAGAESPVESLVGMLPL